MYRTAMAIRKEEATAILKMQGMDNSGRAQRFRRAADKLDGIFRVDINYILDTVTIKYDADKLTLAQVKKKLEPSEAHQGGHWGQGIRRRGEPRILEGRAPRQLDNPRR